MRGVFESLAYIHDQNIIHRDIKPGNILLSFRDGGYFACPGSCPVQHMQVKLADFGLAKKMTHLETHSDETGGTLLYQAPEHAKALSYGKPSDLWSCGFVMYEIITGGEHPLIKPGDGVNAEKYKQKLEQFPLPFNFEGVTTFSELAKGLFDRLCDSRPSMRYNSKAVLQHPWITGEKEGSIPLSFHDICQRGNLFNQLR